MILDLRYVVDGCEEKILQAFMPQTIENSSIEDSIDEDGFLRVNLRNCKWVNVRTDFDVRTEFTYE